MNYVILSKTILKKGYETRPKPTEETKCEVFVKINILDDGFSFENSEFFDSCVEVGSLLKIILLVGREDSDVDRSYIDGVRSMFPDEEALITFQDPSGNVMEMFLHLTVASDRPLFTEWTKEQVLLIAGTFKDKGNELFKEGRIRDAFLRFSLSVKLAIFISRDSVDGYNLYLTVSGNMAICQLKFKNFEPAIKLCDKVLVSNPSNVKCLLRRRDGYVGIKNYEKAKEDNSKILELEPSNAGALKTQQFLMKMLHDQESRYNDMVKSMFNALK